MKLTKLIVIVSLLLGAAEFRAYADLGLTLNITASFLIQSTNTFTNARSHSVTTAAPARRVFSTADFLKRLAIDENIAGTFPTNKFPRGARLVATNNTFVVMVGTNVIADVGNIISFSTGDNEIISGTRDTNGLARPAVTQSHLARVMFDDTGINTTNGIAFFLQGLMTETTGDSAVDRNGNYTETHTVSMPSAAGEGQIGVGSGDQRAAVCTGAVSASGKGRLSLVP
jgi:hypothetical protein